jgi:hypothetical protein
MKAGTLKEILDRVSSWPKDAQDKLVRSVAEIETRYRELYHVNSDERAALERSADDVRKGRFASHHEIEDVFSRFHRA